MYTKLRCQELKYGESLDDYTRNPKNHVLILKSFFTEPDGSNAPNTAELKFLITDKETYQEWKVLVVNLYRKDGGLDPI
ncbi:MAG: hypothetical protein HC877_18915 [Thioploca sp.]|nr:hypothetical protein [Thioploca sp.]